MRYRVNEKDLYAVDRKTGKSEKIRTVRFPEIDFTTEIKRGSKLLDKHFGPEWDEAINPDTLNIANANSCVLGQVFVKSFAADIVKKYGAHYSGGLKFLFPGDIESGCAYGFNISESTPSFQRFVRAYEQVNPDGDGSMVGWEELTRQWTDWIRERQAMRRLTKEVLEADTSEAEVEPVKT